MKFVKVDKIPGRINNHKLKQSWDEFMSMNVKMAKAEIDISEYKSPHVARSVWGVSVKRFGYPIDLKLRNGEIYLIRRDM